MLLTIDCRGTTRCLYGEDVELASLGKVRICRASHVEPDDAGRWWADLSPAGGPYLGPFVRRSAAIRAEQVWLEANVLGDGSGLSPRSEDMEVSYGP